MRIQWNKVTWYSKLVAAVLFLAVFWLGFWIGEQYGAAGPIQTASYSYWVPSGAESATGTLEAAPARCGGFIRNAPTCPAGYRCQLSRIPDTGGICVPN